MKAIFFPFMLFVCLLCSCGSEKVSVQFSTPPNLTIGQFAEITAESNSIISGTVEKGASVFVVNNDGASVGEVLVADTNWSCNITGLVEGANRITVRAAKPTGESTQLTVTVTRKTMAPTLLLDPLPPIIKGDALTISGLVSEGVPVFVLTNNTGTDGAALLPGGVWQYTITGLVEGENQVQITSKDVVGNTAIVRASIRKDTIPPVVTLNNIPAITNKATITISGTVEAGATVSVGVDSAASGGAATVVGGEWQYTFTGLAEGDNRLVITATDAVGNASITSAVISKDSQAPSLGLNPVPALTQSDSVTISGPVESGATVLIVTDSTASGGTAAVSWGMWQYTITGLAEGVNQITITATDAAGNAAVSTAVITKDSTPPPLTLNPVLGTTHRNSITISGTVEVGATVSVATDANATGSFAAVSGAGWTYTIDGLVAGDNHFTVSARDAAGNISQTTGQVTLKSFEIIAHRGSSYTAPENTLAAFNLAWQQGADAVELDVFLSSDNRIMVIHDETTSKTAGVDMTVWGTSSDILRTLDVGSFGHFRGSQYAGQRIPFLEEAIATIPPGRRLIVEIKTGPEIAPYLQQVIVNSGKQSQIAVHSFRLDALAAFKAVMPGIPSYYVVSSTIQDAGTLVQTVKDSGLDGLCVDYHFTTPAMVSAAKSAGLGFFTWVIDDPTIAQQFKGYGIDGLFTNRPDILFAKLKP